MAPSLISVAWADQSVNSGASYGGISFAADTKFTRIEVNIGFSAEPITLSTASPPNVDNVLWGIQAIPAGNTPIVLPSGLNDAGWLNVAAEQPVHNSIAWAPSTDDAGYSFLAGGKITWAGQYIVFGQTDVYFTWGKILSTVADLAFYGCMNIWYTD